MDQGQGIDVSFTLAWNFHFVPRSAQMGKLAGWVPGIEKSLENLTMS